MKEIILHACCAPCASYPIKKLIEDNFRCVVFFYNPNIFPFEEYEIRRNELKNYCKKIGVDFFEEKYNPDEFYSKVAGYELEKEKGKRCSLCFNLRLCKTAEFAKSYGAQYFTTTLSVSPHKISAQIFEEGQKAQEMTGVCFLPYDFKKKDGFKISRQIARKNNMYTQSYCGCRYSAR